MRPGFETYLLAQSSKKQAQSFLGGFLGIYTFRSDRAGHRPKGFSSNGVRPRPAALGLKAEPATRGEDFIAAGEP
jgi:hypothetical protein